MSKYNSLSSQVVIPGILISVVLMISVYYLVPMMCYSTQDKGVVLEARQAEPNELTVQASDSLYIFPNNMKNAEGSCLRADPFKGTGEVRLKWLPCTAADSPPTDLGQKLCSFATPDANGVFKYFWAACGNTKQEPNLPDLSTPNTPGLIVEHEQVLGIAKDPHEQVLGIATDPNEGVLKAAPNGNLKVGPNETVFQTYLDPNSLIDPNYMMTIAPSEPRKIVITPGYFKSNCISFFVVADEERKLGWEIMECGDRSK